MSESARALLTFRTTHHAILAEQLLLAAGEDVRVMPLPLAIAAGCGICLRLPAARRRAAAAILARGGAPAQAAFLALAGGYRLFPPPVFTDALGLAAGDAAAIVGCGGKTALANRLALENRHLPVLFSTTARILEPPEEVTDCRLRESDGAAALVPGVNLACLPDETGLKRRGFAADTLARLHPPGGLTLLEADGSRGLPLKGWAAHEPVVPDFVTVTVGVCTLRPLGQLFRPELAHRPELFCDAVGIRGGEAVTREHIARMVAEMFRKAVGRRVLFVNQVETQEMERAARQLAEGLGGIRAVAGSIQEERAWLISNPT